MSPLLIVQMKIKTNFSTCLEKREIIDEFLNKNFDLLGTLSVHLKNQQEVTNVDNENLDELKNIIPNEDAHFKLAQK